MNRLAWRKGSFSAVLLLVVLVITACGGPDVKGTYSNGPVTLELRSGGEASLSMMGDTKSCTYKAEKKQVTLTCGGDSLDFTINDDGSLNGPGFMGRLSKSK